MYKINFKFKLKKFIKNNKHYCYVQVIGGMTWCIESCNFDVDIDLLFRENLTIGQKM